MYALNKRFRLTEYWGMSTATIGLAVGGLLLSVTSIGMWLQAGNLPLALIMLSGGLTGFYYSYITHKNNALHRINPSIRVGLRDKKAKTMEVYFD
jgi:hypothetical protein